MHVLSDVTASRRNELSLCYLHFNLSLVFGLHMQGCKKVAIVAHSMGNRILMAALEPATARPPGCFYWSCGKPQILRHSTVQHTVSELLQSATLVFAAADVGHLDFVHILKGSAVRPANRSLRTLYRSNCDLALLVSMFLNLHCRAGRWPFLEDSFETIDASRSSGRDWIRHGYWAQSRAVVKDLKGVLMRGQRASQRLLQDGRPDGTLEHCDPTCHPAPVDATDVRRHYIIHRP